jgi:hypothetical protein
VSDPKSIFEQVPGLGSRFRLDMGANPASSVVTLLGGTPVFLEGMVGPCVDGGCGSSKRPAYALALSVPLHRSPPTTSRKSSSQQLVSTGMGPPRSRRATALADTVALDGLYMPTATEAVGNPAQWPRRYVIWLSKTRRPASLQVVTPSSQRSWRLWVHLQQCGTVFVLCVSTADSKLGFVSATRFT